MIETNLVALAGTSEAAQDKIAGVLSSVFGFTIISAASLISSEVFKRPPLPLLRTGVQQDEIEKNLQSELGLGWISSKVIIASQRQRVCVTGIKTPQDILALNEAGGMSVHVHEDTEPIPGQRLTSVLSNQTINHSTGLGSDLPFVIRSTSIGVNATLPILPQLNGVKGASAAMNPEPARAT